ncbi:MAG TPA: hypothetical protein DHV16_01780 [Nitrospiraceae bacterium]|nr:MAG: hypothetical protein A2Z82_09770 [Nitrospirae bacterium GWA2_46_11]OGW25136.1 MAG: hypothetical protein A2X55_11665 [Nitrospirae bacterium GWB2_47_37]HAK89586.1 hypothetical protein [Nitrospiraceae bacterium]HCL82249.1 hypothetical protein [Nitrospiraceae bacterium]HCZ10993.1 hypothetical protein [Nitrospiraceae bacterium]
MSSVLFITILTFVLHIPFGYFRSRAKKYSLKWFIYIHIPIPFIVLVRIITHTDYKFIPLFVIAAVAGQFFGGKLELKAG